MRRGRESKVGNRIRKEAAFVLFTVFLVLGLWIFVSDTVMSQTEENILVDEASFQELEANYVENIKGYLEERGFQNTGITLTRTTGDKQEREYCVTLHHKRMDKLNDMEKQRLFEEIKEMAFGATGCNFQVNLLEE